MKRAFAILLIALTALVVVSISSATASPTPPSGWPSMTGTLSGDGSGGCGSPVVLTSNSEEGQGWSAYDFNIDAGMTFAELPVGGLINHDFTILSGTQAWGEPYMIVRFTDATQVFVYSVEINGPGTGTYFSTLAGNVYIDYAAALASYGTKVVDSVTLAVDNGDLSVEFPSLMKEGCPSGSSAPVRPPNQVFLCNNRWQVEPFVFNFGVATALMGQKYDTGNPIWWEPFAVKGASTLTQIGGYSLICNTDLKPTGLLLGDAGEIRNPADNVGLGFAKIVK